MTPEHLMRMYRKPMQVIARHAEDARPVESHGIMIILIRGGVHRGLFGVKLILRLTEIAT